MNETWGREENVYKSGKLIWQLLSPFSNPFFGVKFLDDYGLCSIFCIRLQS
jgi:hypothetical protein